jgi:hypothetical protein
MLLVRRGYIRGSGYMGSREVEITRREEIVFEDERVKLR